MARRRHLSTRLRRWVLPALAAAVLGGHLLLLDRLAAWRGSTERLQPLAAPLYTRLLQPQAPPPPPATAAAPVAAPRRASGSLVAVAPPAAPPPVPAPAPAEPAPVTPPAEPPQEQAEESAAAQPDATKTPDGSAAPQEPASSPGPAEPAAAGVDTTSPAPPEPPAATSSPSDAAAQAAQAADRWPRDTRLNYRLGGRYRDGDLYGDARVSWQRDGLRYQVRVEVDITPFASLAMTSQGEVSDAGLLPQAYEETRRSGSRLVRIGERGVTLANGTVVPKPAGVQDTASQFVELSQRFASGREVLEVGRSITFWMARPGAVDQWTYEVVGQERLRTPQLGDIDAFHLKPRPLANPRGNITAEMWFAPALQYLPVRIRVNMGTEAHVDLLVETIEQR